MPADASWPRDCGSGKRWWPGAAASAGLPLAVRERSRAMAPLLVCICSIYRFVDSVVEPSRKYMRFESPWDAASTTSSGRCHRDITTTIELNPPVGRGYQGGL